MRFSSFMRTLAFASTSEAIQAALAHGLQIDKAGDPVEGPRTGLTLEDAEAVAAEDVGLLSVNYTPGTNAAAALDNARF